jgi:hypothetical protein
VERQRDYTRGRCKPASHFIPWCAAKFAAQKNKQRKRKEGLKYPRKYAVTLFLTFSEEETWLTNYLAGPVGYPSSQEAVSL